MRGLLLSMVAVIMVVAGARAQSNWDKLSELSKARNREFLDQKEKARQFALGTSKKLSFTDDRGNTIRLMGVTPSGLPIYFSTLNANAATTTQVVALRSGGASGLNLLGKGITIAVWDGGVAKDHIELGSRIIAKESATVDNHATHVTGTLLATGVNPQAKGMAPLAEGISQDFDNDEAEMAALAGGGLLLSNHSYGSVTGWFKQGGSWFWSGDVNVNAIEDYRFGFYGERSRTIDQVAALAPYYTIVWATGNDRGDTGDGSKPVDCNGGAGYDCIIPEAVAKNVISVGAVNKVLNYTNSFDVTMSSFSSWGPTDDGRIKPDLVGDGVGLFSLSSTGSNTYTTLSGTSMATPNVAGSLMLLQELYKKLHGGQIMKAATLKALAIHTAKEAGATQGPDYSFGWGLLDTGAAGNELMAQDGDGHQISELNLKEDSTYVILIHPKANQKVKATIVWTDPAATPASASLDPGNLMLVNDLDLRIIDDQGREQLPWALDPANPSRQAMRADNFRDNVERLEFDSPEAKDYRVVVRHKGHLTARGQDFSLVLSYQPQQSVRTLYWIGDNGDWNDINHWSLTSGGANALTIPAFTDRVIIDENSFDGIGQDVINMSGNGICATLRWVRSGDAALSLNGHTLTITSELNLASDEMHIASAGLISLQAGLTGVFNLVGNDLTGATLAFDGGSWTINGSFTAAEMRVGAGSVKLAQHQISIRRLTSGAFASKLTLAGATIHLAESSTLDGNLVTLESTNSSLSIDSGPVTLHWTDVDFPGRVSILSGMSATIEGDNRIGALYSEGNLNLTGSNEIETFQLTPTATLILATSTTQSLLSTVQLSGTSEHTLNITSPGPASLQFLKYAKLCFDFLNVTNVEAVGEATVNAGLNSSISGAVNWRQDDCNDVLFADFDIMYPCAKGQTEFNNNSSGNITTSSWSIDGTEVIVHDAGHEFVEPGTYPVKLTVSDAFGSVSVTKDIQISANSVPANSIIYNGVTLTSFLTSPSYQWYRNGVKLDGQTARTYSLPPDGQIYFVVTADGECSRISDPFTITGLADGGEMNVYPVPANEFIRMIVPNSSGGKVTLIDNVGRKIMEQDISSDEIELQTASLPSGAYVLNVSVGSQLVRRRVIVLHD